MSAIRRVAVAVAIAFVIAAAAPAAAVERIIQYLSDVTVERSGDLLVTETIQVEAEGKIIQRGIFRDFPTVYRRPDGTRVEVGFHLMAVTRNGEAENHVLERIDNGMRVRMGHADRLLARGQHTYVLRFRTTRQIGFFTEYDELYWNVTGTGWAFPIDRVEARITLPEKVPFRQTAVYTGPEGGKGKDAAVVEQQQPGRIVFRTTRPLPPKNGLTVAAAWQKGVVDPPTTGRHAQYWLEDNRGLAIAAVGFLFVLGYYGLAWWLVGRDPPAGTIIPLFGPPDGISPAAARYVDRMSFDNHCFTAAIVSLGVKGHLRIVEDAGISTLEKRDGARAAAPEEDAMLARLFAANNTILLKQANHIPLGRAKNGLSEHLDRSYVGKLFANNYAWSGIGLGLVLLIVLAVLIAVGTAQTNALLAMLVMTAIFGLPFAMGGGAMAFLGWQRGARGRWLLIGGLAMLLVAAVATMVITWNTEPGIANQVLIAILMAISAIAGAGFLLLKAPSRSGRKTMDQIEGFREYLSVAEEDRLNALNQPTKTPELFEKFLPYAIALDCQNAWAAKFAGVLATAGVAAAAASWYVGNRDWASDPVSFADHLGGSLASTLSSSSATPGSSSGSGGGGSSGGGGGGGGGGGW